MPSRPILAITLVLICAVLPIGCGGSSASLLSKRQASQLSATVDTIAKAVESADCPKMQARIDEALVQVTALPSTVDKQLVKNIRAWLQHMRKRIPTDCQNTIEDAVEPEEAMLDAPLEKERTDKREEVKPLREEDRSNDIPEATSSQPDQPKSTEKRLTESSSSSTKSPSSTKTSSPSSSSSTQKSSSTSKTQEPTQTPQSTRPLPSTTGGASPPQP